MTHDKCRQIFQAALLRGEVERRPCERCGAEPAQAHHTNYDEPLMVTWLCDAHHGAEHVGRGRKPAGPFRAPGLLTRWRNSLGLTSCSVSASLGVTQGTWSHWENGSKEPRIRHALAIETITRGEVPVSSWGEPIGD